VRWWTWAGGRANALIASALTEVDPTLVKAMDHYDNRYLKLRGDTNGGALRDAVREARAQFGDNLRDVNPFVSDEAVKQLKFADLLPSRLAASTLAARLADRPGAASVMTGGIVFR
jgi:ATP-dependent Lhr-like helicase